MPDSGNRRASPLRAKLLMKLQKSLDQVESHLASLEDQKFDHLSFDWEGIRFKVAAEEGRDGTPCVKLNAKLGRLFFTIENAANRAMAIERLYSNNRNIDGAYRIDNSGEVHFSSITTTKELLVGKELLIALTTILLQSETHLRTLRSHLKPIDAGKSEKLVSSSAAA